jgi:secreted PhoX family phosphatase
MTTFQDLLEKRIKRRTFLGSAVAAGGYMALATSALAGVPAKGAVGPFDFTEIPHDMAETDRVAKEFLSQVLIRWGDPLFADSPAFNPAAMDSQAQKKQFGYNNDFIAFMPLPKGSGNSDHGLLCVNHEYTVERLMHPRASGKEEKKRVCELQMAAHGHSVLEIKKDAEGNWQMVKGPYNRRFNALDTLFTLGGPAAGDKRLQTKADPEGRTVTGTLNNCAGGVTPWGTVLVAEENFNEYFYGSMPESEKNNYQNLGIGNPAYPWHIFFDRFDMEKEPHEANRFGWVWEYDPYTPDSVPVKRTALGRFKHEGATLTLSPQHKVVIYSGDDEAFQFVYRFVSQASYKPGADNSRLLDEGTLCAAQFTENGLKWLPLVYGQGVLTEKNGFTSQADVLIETRKAARLMGATPMDRPEDIEVSPVSGKVYVALTGNAGRKTVDKANPREGNRHGHIVELVPPAVNGKPDHSANEYTWDIFLLAGNPENEKDGAYYRGRPSTNGWLSCPDNLAFDYQGNLWIATDGQDHTINAADGLYVAPSTGAKKDTPLHLYNAPKGAEVTGPCVTPDGKTIFISVQHPGDNPFSTYHSPSTRWPDFNPSLPPRPSVVAIHRKDGKTLI